jgi:GMP synthase (glutamine-hydrolysing)
LKSIAILDCAIKNPSISCFNQLVDYYEHPFSYHQIPQTQLKSLESLNKSPSAYIIFGSASNVEERLKWQTELAQYLKEKILQGIPVLGICFGHQLIADAFGCKIEKNQTGESLRGIRSWEVLNSFGPYKKGNISNVLKYHSYQVSNITDHFIHVGSSQECFYDVIALKDYRYIGIQGHPEGSLPFVQNDMLIDISTDQFLKANHNGLQFIKSFLEWNQLIK